MGIWKDPEGVSGGSLPQTSLLPEDRKTWWAIQVCAHAAFLMVIAAAGYLFYRSELAQGAGSQPSAGLWFFVAWVLIPSLLVIQWYYVPAYYRVVRGTATLWRYLLVPALPGLLGLLLYPAWWYFVSTSGADALLDIVMQVSALALAEAILLHALCRRRCVERRQTGDLLPPSSDET